MKKLPLVAGNWKMNTTVNEAEALVRGMLPELDIIEGVDKVICPPFVSLAAVSSMLQGTSIATGAQNMYFEDKGAFTGEISPLMLKQLCKYVIIGHSERRQLFNETDYMVNKKIKKAFEHGLLPILCVGETLDQRQKGQAEETIAKQLTNALDGIESTGNMLVAYEPIWAIGTGKAASTDDANLIMNTITCLLTSIFGAEPARGIRLLYGGSVTAENFEEFINQPDIDGALVGGASLKPEAFTSIVKQAARAKEAL